MVGPVERANIDEALAAVSIFEEGAHWGNHFGQKAIVSIALVLIADMIRKYVRYQEKKEQQMEQLQLGE